MGTRGFLGFVADGVEKIAYNHSDSYPEHLGQHVLDWLRTADLELARRAATELRVVNEDAAGPNDEEIAALSRFADRGVGERTERPTWYQLLRRVQGRPDAILAAGFLEDASTFPLDSVFAEWGYVVDFDTEMFEVYRGFQKEPHDKGRFADRPSLDRDYWPCALVASWPLKELPSDEDFVAAFQVKDDD